MTTSILNLTNSKDIVANSISLKGPDGSIVDITTLFATQDQLSSTGGGLDTQLTNYPTFADLTSTMANYETIANHNASLAIAYQHQQ